MANERSPNYPAIGLSSAIRYIEAFWKQESRTTVPPLVAVAAMGYGALSGSARVVLGGLKQFGLLEKSAQGIKLSDLAIRILHPASDEERQEAIREAAMTPPLFRELARTHAKASDAAISSYLVTQRQFAARGVRECIKAFRDTMSVASLNDGGYTQPTEKNVDVPMIQTTARVFPPAVTVMTAPEKSDTGVLFLRVPFPNADLSVRVEIAGAKLTDKHIARIRKYLELAEEDLKDASDPAVGDD